MNDAIAQRLAQVIKYNGPTLLADLNSLRRLVAAGQLPAPPEVEALVKAVEAKAVAFIQKWSVHPGDKPPFATVRDHIAGKLAQAGVLTLPEATWALDAWARALTLLPAENRELSLEEFLPPPAPPEPPAAPAAETAAPPASAPAAAARSAAGPGAAAAAAAGVPPVRPRSPLLAPMGQPLPPPEQAADQEEPAVDHYVAGGRAVGAGQGWGWIKQGWDLFTTSPGMWIATVIVYVVVVSVMGLVPVIGALATLLLSPVFFAGLMLCGHAVYQGQPLTLGTLFAGFQTRVGALMLIGLVFGLGSFAIVAALALVFGAGLLGAALNPALLKESFGLLLGALLVGSLLFIPLLMAYYFAPPLVSISERGVGEALKASFSGCLRNLLPFLVYFLVLIPLAIAASLPFGLGWIVLAPVMAASTYAAFRDIYYEAA